MIGLIDAAALAKLSASFQIPAPQVTISSIIVVSSCLLILLNLGTYSISQFRLACQ